MTDDPGWGSLRTILLGLVLPQLAVRRAANASGTNGLIVLRTLFLAFASALVLFGVVVFLVTSSQPDTDVGVAVAAIVLLGVVALTLARVVPRPLACTDATALASSYRTRFFLRIAFSEAIALVGFVAAFITGSPLTYLVGAAFTAVGYSWATPTSANLRRDDDALRLRGCAHSLVAALQEPAPR